MSGVPAEARAKQKLKVLIDARRLCKYSLVILQNNNSFKTRPSGNEDADLKNPPHKLQKWCRREMPKYGCPGH